jgi:hypothetical protein
VLLGLSALGLADIVALVSVPTAMFLCVYLSCTAAATRILTGPTRVAAAVAVLAVLAVLAFCGWQALLAVAVVATVAGYPALRDRAERGITPSGNGWQAAAAGPAVSVASLLSQPRSAGAPMYQVGALLDARAVRWIRTLMHSLAAEADITLREGGVSEERRPGSP